LRTTFVHTLTEIADQNPDLWLLSGDLGFSVLEHFVSRHSSRYINVGVAEQNLAGLAAGLALSGKTVFIYSIGNFPTLRCLEQLRNDVCHHGADVKVVSVGGGFAYGSQGYTHHAIEDVAIMSALPGMEVFVPCDPTEVRLATRLIAASRNPSYLRLSRAGEPLLHATAPADLRKIAFLRRGNDVTVMAAGPVASLCLEAADALAMDGIEAAVVSVPCLKPLDQVSVQRLAGAGRPIVTVEEHILRGGLYAGIACTLAPMSSHPPVIGLGIDEPAGKVSTAGDRDALLLAAGLSAAAIADKVRSIVRNQSGMS
jgi:transketolase